MTLSDNWGYTGTSCQWRHTHGAPLTRPNMAATRTGVGDRTIFSPVSGAKNKDPQTLRLQQKWRKLHYSKEHNGAQSQKHLEGQFGGREIFRSIR